MGKQWMDTKKGSDLEIFIEKGNTMVRLREDSSIGTSQFDSKPYTVLFCFQSFGSILNIFVIMIELLYIFDLALTPQFYYSVFPLLSLIGYVSSCVAIRRYRKVWLIPHLIFDFISSSIYLYIIWLKPNDFNYYFNNLTLHFFSDFRILKGTLIFTIISQWWYLIVLFFALFGKLITRNEL